MGRLKDGAPAYRKVCLFHHNKRTAAKHGLQSIREVSAQKRGMTPKEYSQHIQKQIALSAGFKSYTAYTNSTHPYRRHRKTFCENIDGRLGYVCESVIRLDAQLEVDHIDGNPKNNDASNLQTLCMLCHKFKTLANKDYTTPGRKALGVA
jgi:5-methylcytosine-specific restriction endonuclease McrA